MDLYSVWVWADLTLGVIEAFMCTEAFLAFSQLCSTHLAFPSRAPRFERCKRDKPFKDAVASNLRLGNPRQA
jgi:hypothetical protein